MIDAVDDSNRRRSLPKLRFSASSLIVALLWCLSLITATSVAIPQQKTSAGGFRESPTEHIIAEIEQPFVVRSVRGVVIRKEGFRGPLPDVLFEIQGPGAERNIRKGTTDHHGRFKIDRVPAGTYKFKATLNGFQSVMGTVVVSDKAKKAAEIKLEMPLGV